MGPIFQQEGYGIVVKAGSPPRKNINTALLTLKENGEYQELYEKWFMAP